MFFKLVSLFQGVSFAVNAGAAYGETFQVCAVAFLMIVWCACNDRCTREQ